MPLPSAQVGVEAAPADQSQSSISPIAAIIAAVVVVILLVIVGFVLVSTAPAPSSGGPRVNITGLNVNSPDNACGLNGDDSGTVNLNPQGGGFASITWGLPGPGASVPCTVNSVSTSTPGFELFGSFPFNATSFPSVLIVSMLTPSSFNGVLNVTFT